MGYILYKLSNLHTWEQRLRERGGLGFITVKLERKTETGGSRGRARQSINPVIEKNWGNFILRDICERKTEPILLAFACDL